MGQDSEQILNQIRSLAADSSEPRPVLTKTVELLHREQALYNWVGVYLLEKEDLVLGPYVGKPTPHTRIPLHKGICGAAASTGRTIVVDDVNADPRYLACSLDTRSEIVVPILREGRVLGEIDIDSDRPAAFTKEDQKLLEAIAEILAGRL